MEILPLITKARVTRAWPETAQDHPQLRPQEISTLLCTRRETSADDLELIEMRYGQHLALVNLEQLFADGQLDCM